MHRSLMRKSVLGQSGTYELGGDDQSFKKSKSERGERMERKGRKKTRAGSVGRVGATLIQREPRKPAVRRNKSLGSLEFPPDLAAAARRTVDGNNRIRRVKKTNASGDEASDDGSKRSRRSKKSVGSRKSIRSKSKSKRAVLGAVANDDDNNSRRSMRRERIQESKFLAIEAAKGDDEMQEKIESLQSKIVELKQEQLNAQSEAMKFNKEKRELKLELQRSQTVVRELRADLREKDLIVKQTTEKMEALEKAVESQLDKVEDLEEELKRANEEIFMLEDKLQQMELQLVESEGNPDGIAKDTESDFEAKRRERQERRLKEKEKELEERERKLQKQQNAAPKRSSFGGSVTTNNKQLEQDNRMLLKALNREKENSAAKLKSKDAEIQRLNEKVTKFLKQQGGDVNSEVMEENRILAEQLDEEKESHADTITIKDEKIAKLETELRQLRLDGSRGNPREAEAYKTEAIDLRRQLETAQQRNNLLEDEIENWKNKNIRLDDELTELKGKSNQSQTSMNDSSMNNSMNMSSSMNMSFSTLQDDMSDEEGEGSGKRAIGKLWNRVTNMSRRDILSSPASNSQDQNAAKDFISRSTFH